MGDNPKRVLVVGDAPDIREISPQLIRAGFDVLVCRDGRSARQRIEKDGLPHLMLIDLRLPDMDGLELCQELYDQAGMPIITISDYDEGGLAAKVLQYADDYLRKPVAPDELVMRIRRTLSRINNFGYASGRVHQICEGLQVDYVRRQVIVDGKVKKLTPIENALLHVLATSLGKVVDADTLIERVWRYEPSAADRNTLRVHMHRLRQKIEGAAPSPYAIITERGVGYMLMVTQKGT